MSFAILAAILSAAFHPFFPGFARKASHPLTINFWGVCVAGIIFSFCYFRITFWEKVIDHWQLVVLAGILHTVYTILMLSLIKKHEFQVMYPLTKLAPILILIGEILLLEATFTIVQIFGVLSVITGALIFGFDKKIEHVRIKIICSISIITLLAGSYYITDKKLVEFFTASEMWALVFFQIPFYLPIIFRNKKAAIADLKNWKNLAGYSITMIGTWYFAVLALKGLDATSVASVRNLSILFGIMVGAHLFDEGHKAWRYVAAVLIITGAILVVS